MIFECHNLYQHIGQTCGIRINPRWILKCGVGGGAPYDLTDREGINAHVYIPLTVLYQNGLRLAKFEQANLFVR